MKQCPCVRLTVFFCFEFQIPLDWLLWIQITCVQSGRSLEHHPPSQSGCDDTLFVKVYERVAERRPGWTESVPDLILIDCQPKNSGLFKAPIVISLLPHFILVEGNCVYPPAQLSGHNSHQSSRLPASRPSYLCKCCLTCK